MKLNERKRKILEAIINDYIETGEPIGSRTIAKKYDFGISSATIRNEMSDLEELGLIIQPHTSAGRVPSSKGYRLYVDRLIKHRQLTKEQDKFLQDLVKNNINHMDYLMQQTAKALSLITNYTTVVSTPKHIIENIKKIQLIPFDSQSIIVILITENKDVENFVINTCYEFSSDELSEITNALNDIIKKYSIAQIKSSLYNVEKNCNSKKDEIIFQVFETIFKNIEEDENIKLYTSGVNNILDFPEFKNVEKAKTIFQTFEEKDMLMTLLENSFQNTKQDGNIQILIGDETGIEQFKDCSIIKTDYKIDGISATIGIIGPTRMDYAQAISALNSIVYNINQFIKILEDKK